MTIDKRLCCVEVRLLFDIEKSTLIPLEEKIPHTRALVIPHDVKPLPHIQNKTMVESVQLVQDVL